MSVLKTLKGALNNVQHVGTSIKSLKKKSRQPKVYAGVEGVDLDAGADLLNKFHEQWSDMHQQAEHNARAAQKVDTMLRVQYDQCEQQAEAMNRLMSLTSGLPHLLTDITKLLDKIGSLQEQCQAVEDGLITLVDVNEAVQMSANRLDHQRQLTVYKQRKAVDLEQFKVTMSSDHTRRVEGYEAKLQEHLRVKQEVFEEAFAREMQNYRESGSTDMRPLLTHSPQDVELSDISIDQDNSALNAFLDSDDGSPESSTATVTIDEDEEGDEDSYVNIGIITNDISDPELDAALSHTLPDVTSATSLKPDVDKLSCTDRDDSQRAAATSDDKEQEEPESDRVDTANDTAEGGHGKEAASDLREQEVKGDRNTKGNEKTKESENSGEQTETQTESNATQQENLEKLASVPDEA